MHRLFVVLSLLIIYIFSTSEACSCTPEDPHRSLRVFCSADLVADIKVYDTKPVGMFYEFSINFTNVYKMPSKFNETYPSKIYTNQQVSACSWKLPHDLEMIVAGDIDKYGMSAPKGEIGIGSCSYMDTEFVEKIRNGSKIDCSVLKDEQN